MSYSEVKAMMSAIDLRYSRQKEATDQVRSKGANDDTRTIDKISSGDFAKLGVRVNE